jgi:hypothetical protein
MLRIHLSELSLPDRNRLLTELVMVLLAEMTYPTFMDYRARDLRMRPYSHEDRQRAEQFVAGLRLEQKDQTEITSTVLTEQLTDALLSYHRAVQPVRALRRAAVMQRHAQQLAAQVQRRLVAYVLDGTNNGFGLSIAPTSWSESHHAAYPVPWEVIASGTVGLAGALAMLRGERAPVAPKGSQPIPKAASSVIAEILPEMATERLSAVNPKPSQPIISRAAPPDALRAFEVAPPTAPLAQPLELPIEPPVEARGDQAIFKQLREQLLAAMTTTARSYGIATPPTDPAGLLAALRQRNAVDDSDLRLAEGILGLCTRVVAAGRAGLDDYRQGLTLYLLFHRGKFARR